MREQIEAVAEIAQNAKKPVPPVNEAYIDPGSQVKLSMTSDPAAA